MNGGEGAEMKRLPMNGHMRAEHHDTLLSFFRKFILAITMERGFWRIY